jgi:hypothetical protein
MITHFFILIKNVKYLFHHKIKIKIDRGKGNIKVKIKLFLHFLIIK